MEGVRLLLRGFDTGFHIALSLQRNKTSVPGSKVKVMTSLAAPPMMYTGAAEP